MKRAIATLVGFGMIAGAGFAQDLTVWTTFDGPTLDYLQRDVGIFTSTFGVDVEVVQLGINEIKQRMLDPEQQDQAGDVIVGVPHDEVFSLAVGGVLADLGSVATEGYLADLGERSRLAFTYDGRLIGMPLFVEGPALLYNRDLVAQLPDSYEAFVQLSRTLTTSDTFGFLYDIDNFYFAYSWLSTFGGYVFGRTDGTLDPTDVGLANEGAVRGGEELQALRFEHDIVPAGIGYEVANDLFVDGVLAMFYTGPWAVGPAREAGIDVAVAPIPPLADGTRWSGFMSVQGVLVSELSEHGSDAVNLAKWLSRSDSQLGYALLEERVPASRAALSEVADDSIVAGFGQALLTYEPLPNVPEMGRVWGPMATALDVITERADADVEAALDRAVREIKGN